MFKRIVVLSALVISTASAAHADTISGYFSAVGNDTFTDHSITFSQNPATGTPINFVSGSVGGTFADYLTYGNAINFMSGVLPYNQGSNTPPVSVYPSGQVPIFTTSENGATFTFEMTEYNAGYIPTGTGADGCTAGSTCLNVTGMGFFSATGAVNGTSGPATFTFSSQYVTGQPQTLQTTFAASTQATPGTSPVPEPSSLVLLGTGLLGAVGTMRRKLARQA